MASRKYNTRFRPAPGFEARVLSEVSGAGAEYRGRKRKDETKLEEVARFALDRAQVLASEHPTIMPRSKGGLHRARMVPTGQVVPRSGYPFRRNRKGQKEYMRSFVPPIISMAAGRVKVTVQNIARSAQMVEEGTGEEFSPLQRGRATPYRIPITQREYRKRGRMTLSDRRARGLLSGRRDYRAAAQREYRAVKNIDLNKQKPAKRFKHGRFANPVDKWKQIEAGGAGSKKSLRTAQGKRASQAISNRRVYATRQLNRQMKGYPRRFVQADYRAGIVSRSQPFVVKRKRYLIRDRSGDAWLGTPKASRYAGYGIFSRAMQDAVRRFF